MIIFKDAYQGSRHEGLAKTDNIADQHSASLVEMMSGDFYRRCLKLEKPLAEITLAKALAASLK